MEASEIYDTNLLMEGRGKLTTIFNVVEYPKALERDLEVLYPTPEDFTTAIEIMATLLKKGKALPAIDVVLASICMNRDLTFHTKDNHFEIIRKEFPRFKLKEE